MPNRARCTHQAPCCRQGCDDTAGTWPSPPPRTTINAGSQWYGPGAGVLQLLPGGGGMQQANVTESPLALLEGVYGYHNSTLGRPGPNGGLGRGLGGTPATVLCQRLDPGFSRGACEMALGALNADLEDVCGQLPQAVIDAFAEVGLDADAECRDLIAAGAAGVGGPAFKDLGQGPAPPWTRDDAVALYEAARMQQAINAKALGDPMLAARVVEWAAANPNNASPFRGATGYGAPLFVYEARPLPSGSGRIFLTNMSIAYDRQPGKAVNAGRRVGVEFRAGDAIYKTRTSWKPDRSVSVSGNLINVQPNGGGAYAGLALRSDDPTYLATHGQPSFPTTEALPGSWTPLESGLRVEDDGAMEFPPLELPDERPSSGAGIGALALLGILAAVASS